MWRKNLLSKCFRNDVSEYDAEIDAMLNVQYCVESNKKKFRFVWWKIFFYAEKNLFSWCFRCLKMIFFEQWFWILLCIKDLRQINDLIDWNWDSNVEFKLIAKISAFNELNLIEFATKQILNWLINSQNAKTIFLFICDSSFFWIVFLFFHQSMICCIRILMFRTIFNFWKYWNDVFNCIIEKTIDVMWKMFSRKIFDRRIKT